MIYILYSADYELFLGKNNYPENEILITPTYELLDVCKKNGIKLTLFCDTCCLWRYTQLGKIDFPTHIEEQLKYAITEGNDVQCHLHPHWLFTDFTNGFYQVDLDKFLLGNLSEDIIKCEEKIFELLKNSSKYLQNLLTPVNPKYKCIAFRAGGYGIQPKTRTIVKALKRAGYSIDSSVVPGLRLKSNVNQIDFCDYPEEPNYFLIDHPDLFELNNKENGIFEIPIPSLKSNKLLNILYILRYLQFKLFTKDQNNIIKGYPIQQIDNNKNHENMRFYEKYFKIITFILKDQTYVLDVGNDPYLLRNITNKHIKKYKNADNIFFSVNIHPKDMTRNKFEALQKYHSLMKKEYKNIQSITFQEAFDIIQSQ
jgi:hypothetical protein